MRVLAIVLISILLLPVLLTGSYGSETTGEVLGEAVVGSFTAFIGLLYMVGEVGYTSINFIVDTVTVGINFAFTPVGVLQEEAILNIPKWWYDFNVWAWNNRWIKVAGQTFLSTHPGWENCPYYDASKIKD